MRIRLAVTGAVAGGMALTAAAAADGSFALSYENPRLVGAVLTAEALIGLLAAFLVLGRVRRTHRAADLLLCCGLALLAGAQLGLSAIPELVSEEGSRFAAWTGLLIRAGGAALLLAAAILLRLAGAVLFLGAAIGFTRRAERERDVFLVGIAVACVYAFFARVNFVIHPAHELGRFATGDLFVALFHLVVLSAAVAEIFRVWHAEAAAAALDERRRIARDLHDGLAQELASVMRNLHRAGDDHRHVALARGSAERALVAARHAIAP